MTFAQLEIFSVLAKLGSFSRAPSVLGITQTGVSHAIRQLETELGLSLFLREGNTSSLTEVGGRLLVLANDMLQQKKRCSKRPIWSAALQGARCALPRLVPPHRCTCCPG